MPPSTGFIALDRVYCKTWTESLTAFSDPKALSGPNLVTGYEEILF